jgi:hypothetical protein
MALVRMHGAGALSMRECAQISTRDDQFGDMALSLTHLTR